MSGLETLLLNWKLVVIGVLVLALGGMTSLYVEKRDELIVFRAQVEQAGFAQKAKNAELKAEHAANLIEVRRSYENQVPEIRANAVDAYRAHQRSVRTYPSRSGVPSAPASLRVDDAAQPELVLDPAFIENCAEDANQLTAFQNWVRLNRVPVTP